MRSCVMAAGCAVAAKVGLGVWHIADTAGADKLIGVTRRCPRTSVAGGSLLVAFNRHASQGSNPGSSLGEGNSTTEITSHPRRGAHSARRSDRLLRRLLRRLPGPGHLLRRWRLMAAAAQFAEGIMPYRDFMFLHPPGVVLLLTPFALIGRFVGTAGGQRSGATVRGARGNGKCRPVRPGRPDDADPCDGGRPGRLHVSPGST